MARLGGRRNAHTILMGKPLGKRQRGNIKLDLRVLGMGGGWKCLSGKI
jgi:hypothetical protein